MADNQEDAAKTAAALKAEDAKVAAAVAKTAKEEQAKADDLRANAVKAAEEMDALTPTPTQAELDAAKLGGAYKTRQTKAA